MASTFERPYIRATSQLLPNTKWQLVCRLLLALVLLCRLTSPPPAVLAWTPSPSGSAPARLAAADRDAPGVLCSRSTFGGWSAAGARPRYNASRMPPLAPHAEKGCSGGRKRRDTAAAAAGSAGWRRSASFHGRGAAEQRDHHQPLSPKQRPKTQPDLLAGVRGRSFRSASPDGGGELADSGGRRTPSKVLVSVTVQRSMWPLHVMASAEWSVADLVAAAVALYVKEGRRPALPAADPAAFSLHYSQFSLEGLDPNEKVMELGSRSFFLCPKSSATGQVASSSFDGANRVRVITEAPGKAGQTPTPAWLGYMQFWPLM
ncbi:hypothetical protein ACP70R_009588 [Stipagrostis hirtigluma subsp. patula]